MEELVSVMEDIRELLSEMNDKLNSIDINIERITGSPLSECTFDTLCDKLNDISHEIREVSSCGLYSLGDVCNRLEEIDTSINIK